MRLNEQRFETSTGGYEHEQIIMQGGKPKRDVWILPFTVSRATKASYSSMANLSDGTTTCPSSQRFSAMPPPTAG